jgi:quercetin dioxygenase-like cupin family protein
MVEITHLPDLDAAPHATVFPGSEPTTVRLSLAAGERVEPHRHPGRSVVVAVLDGAIELALDGESHALDSGDVARFDGDRAVSPRATESSTALVVLAPTGGE